MCRVFLIEKTLRMTKFSQRGWAGYESIKLLQAHAMNFTRPPHALELYPNRSTSPLLLSNNAMTTRLTHTGCGASNSEYIILLIAVHFITTGKRHVLILLKIKLEFLRLKMTSALEFSSIRLSLPRRDNFYVELLNRGYVISTPTRLVIRCPSEKFQDKFRRL